MSYGVKFRCVHKTETNNNETEYRIDISQRGYSGSITNVLAYGDVFELSYDKIEPTEPLKDPIQKGRLTFNLLVRGATEQDLLEDIFEKAEGEYQMALYQDNQLVWKGYVLNDLLEISEGDFPHESTINAKDFTRLEQFTFPLSDQRKTVMETVSELVDDLGFNLGFKTYTNWEYSEMSGDILNGSIIDQRQLRDFGEIGEGEEYDEDDAEITNFDALQLILKSFGLLMRQSDGFFRLYHLSALTSATTSENEYGVNGAFITDRTVDLSLAVDRSSRFILPSSITRFNAGLKRVRATLVHHTAQSEITFDRNVGVGGGDEQADQVFQQFFNSNGKQNIELKTNISAQTRDLANAPFPRNARIRVAIEGNVNYYLQKDGTWTTDDTTMEIELSSAESISQGQEDETRVFRSSFSVESETIPALADGTLSVTFKSAQFGSDKESFERTVYSTPQFEIISEEDAENSVNIAYQLISDDEFSKSYDHGVIGFGNGPTPYSPSAIRYGSNDDDLTGVEWSFVGSGDKVSFFKLLLQEILFMQSKATRNLTAELFGQYRPFNVLVYENIRYLFLGGSLNGRNIWNADFLELQSANPNATFDEKADAKKAGGFSGASSGTIESFWSLIKQSQFFNTIFLANFVGELTQDIGAGLRTSLPVKLSAPIRIGEDYVVVDKENEKPIFINVVEDPNFTPSFTGEEQETYNTGQEITLHFDDQKFPALPAGSPIILSGGLVQSYFKVDPTKLLIQNERRDDAVIYGRVDSNIFRQIPTTSIDVQNPLVTADNPAVFTDGQKINLRRSDGEIQTLTVNGDQTFTSSPYTLNVQSFTSTFLVIAFSLNGSSKFQAVLDPVNQTSSIEFLKGRLILSADGSGGLAQIRLDGTGGSSSITLDADNINVIGQTTFKSGLFSEGFESQGGAQSKADSAEQQAKQFAQNLVDDIDFEADELAIKDSMAQQLGFTDFTSIVADAVQNDTLIAGAFIRTDLIDVNAIFTNDIVIAEDDEGNGGTIRSNVYDEGVDGFIIRADGSAEFNNIALRTGGYSFKESGVEIDGDNLNVNGTITVGIPDEINPIGGIDITNTKVGQDSADAGGSGDDKAIELFPVSNFPRMTFRSTIQSGIRFRNVLYVNEFGSEYGANIVFNSIEDNGTIFFQPIQGLNLTVDVDGTLTKSSGSFKIDHPVKPDTHHLVHSFTESPQADLIYRGKAVLNGGEATINIDEYIGMTSGTFEALCRNVQVFTSNETSWHRVRGRAEGANVIVECEDPDCTDEINWLVVAERKDDAIYQSSMTDDNGKVILEPEKAQEPQGGE